MNHGPDLSTNSPRLGIVTEPLAAEPLLQVLDWLVDDVPEVTDLEIGTGGYAPPTHCDMPLLLADPAARRAWQKEIDVRGLRLAALNVWGNPLHPQSEIATKHDADLRDTIRLAAEFGVDRVVAMAGCPAGAVGDTTPHFAGGGWLPYLEGVYARQWTEGIEGYWSGLADFARVTDPGLMICLELHPGTIAYNVDTFERLADLGPAISANIDPSHFFWMGMDANLIVRRLAKRIGHAHAKDVVFQPEKLALNGLLDNRWPQPPKDMPWNFATVGRGHAAAWWRDFLTDLRSGGHAHTIAIEHEDPFVPPRIGIKEAARLLAPLLSVADGARAAQ
jgi:sugar phosphate isomerase/epimerase